MINSLVASAALAIGLAGYAVAQEAPHRHRSHHRHYVHTRAPLDDPQPEPSRYAPNIYWSPAGGDPTHYAQTSGFYAGR
jgi:hypothetical protein